MMTSFQFIITLNGINLGLPGHLTTYLSKFEMDELQEMKQLQRLVEELSIRPIGDIEKFCDLVEIQKGDFFEIIEKFRKFQDLDY